MTHREYLINEIKRFYNENGRIPGNRDMCVYNGYPSYITFINEFGSWNNAVEAAGFKPYNKRLTGDEICSVCGIKGKIHWVNSDNGKICMSCWHKQNRDYMNGRLDIDSPTGFAFLSQRIVARKLRLEIKHDCNCTYGLNYPGFDLLQLDNEKYGRIQVKTAILGSKDVSLYWRFSLGDNSECDTYIMLGFTRNKDSIEKVWVISSDRSIVKHRQSLSVYLNPTRIGSVAKEIVKYEVDVKPYNDTYHNMKKLKDCDYLTRHS